MEKQTPRVKRGRIELIVDHEGKELVFVHPSEGPDNYQNVGKKLLKRGLNIPTGDQTASLLYGAYNSQEPEFKEIQEIIKEKWLWVINRNLWTPEGVYVVHDPEARGISQPLSQRDLEEKLNKDYKKSPIFYSSDGSIRFAPKGSYQLGEHTKDSLASDGFIIASFGEEGAEKLAEVSTKFKQNPYIWGVNVKEGQDPVQRVSALGSDWGLDIGLGIGGVRDDGVSGWAFGV